MTFWPDDKLLEEHIKLGAKGLVSTTVVFIGPTQFELQIRKNVEKFGELIRERLKNARRN